LERDARRRGAFSLYWDSNAFTLKIQAFVKQNTVTKTLVLISIVKML